MRHLIYFLLFSSVVFSQNYNYAIDEPKKGTVPVIPTVNNQLEEIEYFKAYLLPVAQKANLQNALDTYGSVRLERGDFRGLSVTLRSNQSLYGHVDTNLFSNVIVEQGSTNVHVENLAGLTVTLQAGNPIKNSTFKTLISGTIVANGSKLENNLFLNIAVRLHLDFSVSGYYRNNKFIKQQSGIVSPIVSIKGNNSTLSYGNVHFWTNLLTPHGDSMVLDNLGDTTFLGVDAEGWNGRGEGNKAAIHARNMRNFKLGEVAGANDYSPEPRTPGFDVQGENLLLIHMGIGSPAPSLVSPNANVVSAGNNMSYLRSAGTVSGYSIDAQPFYLSDWKDQDNVMYNGANIEETIRDQNTINTITGAFLQEKHTPWDRPVFETLPDPLGTNWRAQRIGKPDSTSFIQNLIDTNNIAELPEGIYYIASTLYVSGQSQGIIGSGTGKTVICGLTDDFPLITMKSFPGATMYYLAYLTLQGGSKGQYFPENYTGSSFLNPKFVVYRDQKMGIHFEKMGGTDNCFWDNVSFVNCGIGLNQDPKPITDNVDMSGYLDKIIFYKNQYINCDIGTKATAIRANNLNAWVNCKYDGNRIAFVNSANSNSMMANCNFTNNTGEYVLLGNALSLYSCNFNNNTPSVATINFVSFHAEGCNFLDTGRFSARAQHNPNGFTIVNSTISGNIMDRARIYGDWAVDNFLFINTSLTSHSTLSKFMTTIRSNPLASAELISTVLIDSLPNPYPQFLVTQ